MLGYAGVCGDRGGGALVVSRQHHNVLDPARSQCSHRRRRVAPHLVRDADHAHDLPTHEHHEDGAAIGLKAVDRVGYALAEFVCALRRYERGAPDRRGDGVDDAANTATGDVLVGGEVGRGPGGGFPGRTHDSAGDWMVAVRLE